LYLTMLALSGFVGILIFIDLYFRFYAK
jgi:hypothetical protein